MVDLRRRELLSATAVSSLSLVGGCISRTEGTHPVTDPVKRWPSFRGDRANTGYAKGVGDTSEAPSIEWTYETGDAIWSSPAISDGVLYIGSADRNVYALDAHSGELQWEFETGHRVESTPCVSNGIVCFGSYDKHIYALDAETGELIWEFETDGMVRASPTIDNGTVYIPAGCHNLACAWYAEDEDVPETGRVYALELETGDHLWDVFIDDEVVSTPAFSGETIYVGASNGSLYAFDSSSGEEEWRYTAADMMWSSPTFAFETVFVGDWDGILHAVDADTGTERWTFDTEGDYISASTAVDEANVYVGMTPVNHFGDAVINYADILAIDRESGREHWRYHTDALENGSSPLVTDEMVYVGTHAPSPTDDIGMLGLSLEGELEWFFEVGGRGVGSSPALLDETLYFGGTDGSVYALR